jgi:hypothetical protein
VHAIAVKLAGNDVGEIAVPHVVGALGQSDALDLAPAFLVEQAQFDLLGMGTEQREVRAATVPGRAKRMGFPGLNAIRPQERNRGQQAVGGQDAAPDSPQ